MAGKEYKAKNRDIKTWLGWVSEGSLVLPRFQRMPVWRRDFIEKFLMSIHNETPLGVLLIVEINRQVSSPAFKYRELHTAPPAKNPKWLLLDGQQRITALWQVFEDRYADGTFCLEFSNENGAYEVKRFRLIPKNEAKEYQSNPGKQFSAGKSSKFIPMKILSPLVNVKELEDWVQLIPTEYVDANRLKGFLKKVKAPFSSVFIPCFELLAPDSSKRSRPINIFIDINTGSVKLTSYNIAVARIEDLTKKSIEEEILPDLIQKTPSIEKVEKDLLGELVLKISCVIQDKAPTGANYKKLKYEQIFQDKDKIINGIVWTLSLLEKINVKDGNLLPSRVPLRVLPALHEEYAKVSASSGKAKVDIDDVNKVINKYLWHAFLTSRYGAQANQRLKEDYDDLCAFINGSKAENDIKIFKEPPPTLTEVRESYFPKGEGILSKGILLTCCIDGAEDIISKKSIKDATDREYHYIFPRVRPEPRQYDIALNCIFVRKKTCDAWGDSLAGVFMEKQQSKDSTQFSFENLEKLFATHCVLKNNFELLKKLNNSEISSSDREGHYNTFIDQRTKDVKKRIDELLENGK